MKEKITEYIEEHYPELVNDILLADGFEEAFLGVAYSYCSPPKACYNTEKCIEILQKRDGMTYKEAFEFFEYNVSGAYVGEFTPSFINTFDRKQLSEGDVGDNDYLG